MGWCQPFCSRSDAIVVLPPFLPMWVRLIIFSNPLPVVEEEQFSKAAFWLDSPRKRYNVNRLQVSSHLAAVAVFICLPGQEPVTRTVGLAELAEKGLLLAMLPRMAFKNRRQ